MHTRGIYSVCIFTSSMDFRCQPRLVSHIEPDRCGENLTRSCLRQRMKKLFQPSGAAAILPELLRNIAFIHVLATLCELPGHHPTWQGMSLLAGGVSREKCAGVWSLVLGVQRELLNDVECGIEGGVPAGRPCVPGEKNPVVWLLVTGVR